MPHGHRLSSLVQEGPRRDSRRGRTARRKKPCAAVAVGFLGVARLHVYGDQWINREMIV